MYKIGITGTIGAGKTTIATLFAKFNIPIFDADIEIKEILTRKETERKGLIFKNSVYRKKFKNNKLQCSICKKLKILSEFPNDIHGWKNKKRSNCSECDIDRNFNYLNNMNSLKKKLFIKICTKI